MRATPPSRRMSAGTRSSAITAHAPASSAMRAYYSISPSRPRNSLKTDLFDVHNVHDDSTLIFTLNSLPSRLNNLLALSIWARPDFTPKVPRLLPPPSRCADRVWAAPLADEGAVTAGAGVVMRN